MADDTDDRRTTRRRGAATLAIGLGYIPVAMVVFFASAGGAFGGSMAPFGAVVLLSPVAVALVVLGIYWIARGPKAPTP